MVTSKQLKEKIRDYRRSFKHSWQLFRASKIGMFGLIIMMMFIIIALISPFLGLRHPMDWWAPDEDIIDIEGYFGDVDGVGTKGVFDHAIGYRLRPLGVMGYGERLYVGGGDGSPISPYGVYAFDPQDGSRVWNARAFLTQSPVSTGITVENFGSVQDPQDAEIRLIFGCENGKIYALKDDFSDPRAEYPPTSRPDDVVTYRWEAQLDGPISERVAVFNNKTKIPPAVYGEFDNNDLIFASTENGTLYAFQGPAYIWDDVNGTTVLTRPTLLWSTHLSNYSLTAPTVSADGKYVFVGSRDGQLHGLLTAAGTSIPGWGIYEISDTYWSSNPICMGTPPIIYATTDDGYLHSIKGIDGTARDGWDGGYSILNAAGEEDGGNLTTPTVSTDGGTIMFGSTTGHFYSVDSNLPDAVYPKLDFDTRIGTLGSEILVTPYYDSLFSRQTYIAVNNQNGTASDRSDDFTILYCLDQEANVTWRKTLDGVVLGTPISYNPAGLDDHLFNADVVMATVTFLPDGTLAEGTLYSFASTGENKSPLKPTWVEASNSGNTYWLGTDDRGHDILSQTLLGSRIALLVGFLSAGFSIGIGLVMGLVSGYYGGNVDSVLMRFTDVILVLPALPLLIVFAAMMSPSIWNIIFIIAILGWGGVARVIRAEVLSLKERPFIDSARVTGASKSRIMFKHIAPNVLPLAMLYMTFAISGAILYEAALSFIGLGDPTTMTWGMMLNYVQHSNALEAWWWLLPPGICITLVCLAFFLLGRAFDEIVNPRLRRRG